ncbi:MAG TPA: 1-acyl-sn-glycerol-3-phosphate acyltransferase [Phycisphaerales bacterium]|nr:1-acyl-sn-glycerol-3-phosphate acyltransferase [Phycisphaerales bacterium]
MRSWLFAAYYWVLSVFYALLAVIAAVLPGRAPLNAVIRFYTRRMLWAMRVFAGIEIDLRGRERLPQGAFIVAAKHHSWGDGFVMFANIDNLTFVTGDHLEKIPLLRGILHKLGAIVVDSCGGPASRRALKESAAKAHAEGKRILIYPEGHLAKPGEHLKYRTGVFHMQQDFGLPVVPVATNLGLRWRQQEFEKSPGVATVEFLEPIQPGLSKAEFMARLERMIEDRTNELIAMASGEPVKPSVLVPAPA